MFLTIVVFLLILSILVLVHEAGHFFVAKFFKIKVEEFGFGLPLTRSVFSVKRGETVYSLYPALIGGFVKLYGEDEAGSGRISNSEFKIGNKDKDRAFFSKPVWQRALVVFAGVFMNFVLAIAIISFLFSVVGVPVAGNKVVIAGVVKGAPADRAGLKTGDIVESINAVMVTNVTQLVSITKNHLGKEIVLKVKTTKGQEENLKLIPRKNYPANEGPMGVEVSQNSVIKKYPWYEAPFAGTKEALSESWLVISGLGMLLTQLVVHGRIPQDVAGPVGIAQLTGTVVSIGPYAVLSFISLLSLNLGIINILPVPALDGGRLFFILFEAVTRRKVSPKFEGYAHTIGMAFLLLLIALITLHDLIRVFTGQPILPK